MRLEDLGQPPGTLGLAFTGQRRKQQFGRALVPGQRACGDLADLCVRVGEQRHHQPVCGGVVIRRELARGKRADARVFALQQLAPLGVVRLAERQLLNDIQRVLDDVLVVRFAEILDHLAGDLVDGCSRIRQALEANKRIAANVSQVLRCRVLQQHRAGIHAQPLRAQ